MPSDIQVYVRFKEPCVFAGEEVTCTITFKNAANIENADFGRRASRGWPASGPTTRYARSGIGSGVEVQSARSAAISVHGARKTSTAHRTKPSLSIPGSQTPGPRSASWTASPNLQRRTTGDHQRSVSILSFGSPSVDSGDVRRDVTPRGTPIHGRSASVNVKQNSNGGQLAPESASKVGLGVQMLHRQNGPSQSEEVETRRLGAQFGNTSNSAANSDSGSHRLSPKLQNFKFPADGEESKQLTAPMQRTSSLARPGNMKNARAPKEVRRAEGAPEVSDSARNSGRNSGDFYSLSNHSQETLASEQPSVAPERRFFISPSIRQHYRIDVPKPKPRIESLLMGYAQVAASFTLDAALVDQTPFEDVKRKGFLGGQGGGGLVGVQSNSGGGGLLKGFNLNSIGESLGGLLGGKDLSSLKEMKDAASSQSIPLLSTPQSLLFVDLTLAPGEERSFSFNFTLPHGLPASYRGKSIKISYNLTVGVQGLPGEKSVQPIRRVHVPFKVFSGVNEDGEVLGHDMMQPHVILQTTAQTEQVLSPWSFPDRSKPVKDDEKGLQDFLQHVELLLSKRQRRQSSSATLDGPSDARGGEESRAKRAIDFAIMISKQSSQQSRNRFEIARNGKSVATIVLDRLLLRLGETVTASIDISKGQKPCYSLRCTLESTEQVNPALALRSAASITRMSRKIYASQSENTLFAQRVVFSPSIPVSATPTLSTSGVNLHWALRFEFVTSRDKQRKKEQDDESSEEEDGEDDLLEPVTVDDRGSIMAAVESLNCESFEASIPITVYGDKIVAEAEEDAALSLPI